jgi:hypothetical protein
MDFDATRLRRGELLAGAGALLLAVFLLALRWYGVGGRGSGSLTGWQGLMHLRWLALVTILAAFWLVLAQVTRRAPALPVALSVIVSVLGLLTALWLVYRVIVNPLPHEQIGAVLGLISACVLAYGAYLSMREEGISPKDERTDIPTVSLGGGGSPAR